MKKFLKVLLILLVWLLIGAALVGGALLLEWPYTWALEVFAALVVIWYGFKLIRWLWKRHQARKRVEQLINVAPDEEGFRIGTWRLWHRRNEKDERTRDIIKFLRTSDLRSHGDPLYVVPWFLALGSESAGLRPLIRDCKLPRPTLDHALLESDGSDVDWQLYNRGILLAAPSRYSDPSVSGSDEDWVRLLMQLQQYRSREPINGVLISLSVDELLNADADRLIAIAMKYRSMLEDVVQLLGVRVPVSVLLTGCESLPGFADWLGTLEPGQTMAPLGAECRPGQSAEAFAREVVKRIRDHIHQLNRVALSKQQASAELLRLPNNLAKLQRPVAQLLGTLFESNLYQRTPALRGLYLSARMPADEAGKAAAPAFVHDLFNTVMPSQRRELEFVDGIRQQQDRRARWQLAGWAAVVGVVIFALSARYLDQQDFIQQVGKAYHGQIGAATDLDSKVSNLLAYDALVHKLSDESWLPWYSPTQAPPFIAKLKADLSARVNRQLVGDVDQLFQKRLQQTYFAHAGQDVAQAAQYASLLVRRINILSGYLQGDDVNTLMAMPQPFNATLLGNAAPENLDALNRLYVQALVWGQSANPTGYQAAIQDRRKQLRQKLDDVLSHAGPNLTWLVPWANQAPNLKSYKLSDFWQIGTGSISADVTVPAAYTVAGKQAIDGFEQELIRASGDKGVVKAAVPHFRTWYQEQYLSHWRLFARSFDDGMSALQNRNQWLDVINNLTTERNIFARAFDLVETQIAPFKDMQDAPDWVALLEYYGQMRTLSPGEGPDHSKRNKVFAKLALKTIGKLGGLGKAIAKQGKSSMKTQKKLAKASGEPSPDERAQALQKSADQLKDYDKAIADFVYSADLRSTSFTIVSGIFKNPGNPAAGSSSYGKAWTSIMKLQALIGKPTDDNRAFWALYTAPMKLIRAFLLKEASCQFDKDWRDNVLAQLDGVSDYKRDNLLRGDKGLLWTFLSGDAKPYLQLEPQKGYVPVRAQGDSLNFNPHFLAFASKARDAKAGVSNYQVQVHALPTSVNVDANATIDQTTLTMTCADGAHTLNNYNFPIDSSFTWNTSCNDVSLEIHLDGLTLKKEFQGVQAFPDFLKTFARGPKVLTDKDFPRHRSELQQLGVSQIIVQYKVDGAGQLLQSLDRVPLNVPQHAAFCWKGQQG